MDARFEVAVARDKKKAADKGMDGLWPTGSIVNFKANHACVLEGFRGSMR